MTTRIMPERCFMGASFNRSMVTLYRPGIVDMRPLAPGERLLGDYILPPFQRPSVWTPYQQVRLIESIYMGMPIGAIVVNATTHGQECDGWLLDGQQRLTAILEYLGGRLTVRGWRFQALPEDEQRHFFRLSLAIVETTIRSPEICRDVYDRLVYGGTPHAPA